ncbi:MAG: hypothetical protein ACREF3_03590, partial [Acetobacteraceae bacterium]
MRVPFCVAALALLFSVGAVPAVHATPFGRFLKQPADSSIVFKYNQPAPIQFDQQVFCDGVKCGDIKFDYATYLRKPTGTTSGGAALSGGFYLAPGVSLAPGHKLAWVQTVESTRTGENNWGIDPATGPFEFPDASRTSPAYPFTTTAAAPPNPPGPPTLGFQDFPSRRFANGNQFWLAELGLVCIDGVVKGVTQA